MQLADVVNLWRAFDAAHLPFWVDGGWGVDVLVGRQTRPHADLDLAVHLADIPLFERVLTSLGYHRKHDDDAPIWNPVFAHETDGSVDLHGFVLNAIGEGILGEPEEGSKYPAGSLGGSGVLGAMRVRCIDAPFVLQFRNSFEPRSVDYVDVATLCDHFGLSRPSRFR